MSRLLAPFARSETYRALLFFLAQLALGIVAWVVVITGWSVTIALAITPLVIPLLVGLRWGVGLLARAQAAAANELIGTSVHPPIAVRGRGFWGWGSEVLTDRPFWRQQAHLMVAWPLALIPLSLISFAVQALLVPLSYRRWESEDVFGIRGIDTLAEALLFVPLGLAWSRRRAPARPDVSALTAPRRPSCSQATRSTAARRPSAVPRARGP